MLDFKTDRTLKEWLLIAPHSLLDKFAFLPLILWCLLPIMLIGMNLWFPYQKHEFNYYVMMVCGSFGLLVGIVSFLKYKLTGEPKGLRKFFKEYPERLFFLGMLLWGFISCFFAENIYKAFMSNIYRYDGFTSYIFYVGFFMAMITLKSEKLRKILLHTMSAVATILSLLTFLQLNRVPMRAFVNFKGMLSAVFENSNHFGYYLVIAVIVTAILFVLEKARMLKLLLAIEYIVICVGLFASDSFACYWAAVIGMIFSLVILLRNKKEFISIIIILALFILGSIIFDLKYQTIRGNFGILVDDMNKIAESDDTAGSSRIGLWKDAVYFIGQKPLFGYGIENMEEAYSTYKPMKYDRPHNEYLQHAVFMGIPAALLYLAGISMLFVRCFKRRKLLTNSQLIGICTTGAYVFSAFFGNTMFYTTPYFIIVLAMASSHNSST